MNNPEKKKSTLKNRCQKKGHWIYRTTEHKNKFTLFLQQTSNFSLRDVWIML